MIPAQWVIPVPSFKLDNGDKVSLSVTAGVYFTGSPHTREGADFIIVHVADADGEGDKCLSLEFSMREDERLHDAVNEYICLQRSEGQ